MGGAYSIPAAFDRPAIKHAENSLEIGHPNCEPFNAVNHIVTAFIATPWPVKTRRREITACDSTWNRGKRGTREAWDTSENISKETISLLRAMT